LADACQVLLLLAEIKTRTKAKAKKVMKEAYTQLSFDL
jgi:UbiD family decarboxylase